MNEEVIKKLLKEKQDFAFLAKVEDTEILRVHFQKEHGNNLIASGVRYASGWTLSRNILKVFKLVEVK